MNSSKIGIIVQARMGSSRLPGKVLRKINGRTLLSLLIERLKKCNFNPIIIIATSNQKQDQAIVEAAKSEGVEGFAASCDENDVLSRYILAAKEYGIKIIVRVTADCPLIDPKIIDSLMERFMAERPDYLTIGLKRTFPHGVDAEIFTLEALERSSKLSNQIKEREHVVLPMRNNPHLFKIINVEAEGELRRPDIRITVDYPEDFELVSKIYELLLKEENYISTLKIINFLDKNPKIKAINNHLAIQPFINTAQVKIGSCLIGEGHPAFIIAEIGSNYNGNLNTARQMIKLAKEAGVNAVKFQIFKEKGLYPSNAGKVDYLKKNIEINDIVKKAEVPNEYHKELRRLCLEEGALYLCTPTDEECADYLEQLDVPAFKIASYEMTNLHLLKYIAKKGKPMIISTGASDLSEVAKAVKTIREQGNQNIIIMQCVAKYPAELEYTNLKVMDTFRNAFNTPVGLSDHSFDPYIAPFAAVAKGANIIEKHFTLNRNQDGPDHSFAVEPHELSQMVKGIRGVEKTLGISEKQVLPVEKELKNFTLSSIFAVKSILKGKKISSEDIAVLRPGKKLRGLSSEHYELVVGSRAQRDIESYEAVQLEDIIVRD